MDVALKVAERQHELEMNSRLSARMSASVRELGKVDSFRHTVLSHMARENYEGAIHQLEIYLSSKSEYPQFEARAGRYLRYAKDLINAIKVKRSFPGLEHLAMSKQQELFDRAMEHFEDLKATLRKIEQVDVQVRLDDVRSTVWVVKALIYSVFAILILAFLMELSRGVLPAASVLVDNAFGDVVNFVFDSLGL